MSVKRITAKELYERLQKRDMVNLIDVRAEEKYNEFHIDAPSLREQNIPKSIIFGLEETGGTLSLPRVGEIVVACTTGNSATKCANILAKKNYNAVVLEGGLTAWKDYLKSLEG